jgi:Wiskott-Aldrich syndrome protein
MGKKPLLAVTVLGLGLAFTGCQNSPKPPSTAYDHPPTFPRNTATVKQDGTAVKPDNGLTGPATTTNVAAPGAGMQTIPSGRTNLTNTPAPGGTPSFAPTTGHAPQDSPPLTQPTGFTTPGGTGPVPPPPLGTTQQVNRPVVVDPTIHDVPAPTPVRTDTGLGRPPAVPPSDNLLDHPGQPLPAIDNPPARGPLAPPPPPAPLPASDLGGSAPPSGTGPSLAPPPPTQVPAPALPEVPPPGK